MIAGIDAFKRRRARDVPMSPDVPKTLGTREANRDGLSPVSPLSPYQNTLPAIDTAKSQSVGFDQGDQSNGTSAEHPCVEINSERTLSDGEKSALAIAERAIAQAALTHEQKRARLADLRRDPAIARFWAMAWPENADPNNQAD